MSESKSSAEFSPAQKEAVTFGGGPLLVLAGPGSGKTFVITHRVRYLIESLKVPPANILVVTFSRAAAREMEERFLRFGTGGRGRVTFGTFHSVFFGILRTAYGYRADQVASDEERMQIVLKLIRAHRIESDDQKSLAINLLSEIALVKEERAELAHYYSTSCPAETFREVFRAYEEAIGSLQKIDYEDMLLMTYELLKGRPEILRALSERWQWILVDEFQDINRLQYEIVRMIAGERCNLTIVGDDDQSIYRFRGAKPEIMLGFEKDHPNARRVLLDINFRSTPEIVMTAGRLISRNKSRFPKEIRAFRPKGKPVNTVVCPDPLREAAWITADIRARVRAGMSYGDIAILYRTNLQPRLLSAKLMAENVPFRMKELLPDLMDHWIAKDICAYLRLSRNEQLKGDLLRISNHPNRYIKRDAFREDGEDISALKRYYWHEKQSWMRERLTELEKQIKHLGKLKVYEAIRYIREEIGYDAFLRAYAKEHKLEEEELFEIIEELMDSAGDFRFPEEWFDHCAAFRKELLNRKEQERTNGEEDGNEVHLMTFHASKGLEFPLVYLIDVNDGVVPHRKAGTKDELEEERRMFYVAMTRAKDELIICTAKKRFRRTAEESPFIAEYEKR